jgi:hypothetical protein
VLLVGVKGAANFVFNLPCNRSSLFSIVRSARYFLGAEPQTAQPLFSALIPAKVGISCLFRMARILDLVPHWPDNVTRTTIIQQQNLTTDNSEMGIKVDKGLF